MVTAITGKRIVDLPSGTAPTGEEPYETVQSGSSVQVPGSYISGGVKGVVLTSGSPYTAVFGTVFIDINLAVAAAFTVLLPASPTTGEIHTITDVGGTAAPSTLITIDGNGKTIAIGNATITLMFPGQSASIRYNGTLWVPF